jgi:hypothetical protein
MRTAQRVVFWTVVGLAGMAAFGLLFGVIIQWLWNATLADMFGLPEITFWQAVGIFILAKFLFGFGGGSGPRASTQREMRKNTQQAKQLAAEACAPAAPEEGSDLPGLAEDEKFRRFWREEGKDAYEAYRVRDPERD